MPGRQQDLLLAKKTRERRNAGNSQTGDQKTTMRQWKELSQSSHILHLVAVHPVNDHTRTKKKQSFKKGMCKEMEHRGRISQTGRLPGRVERPQCKHHIAYL